MAEVQKEEQIKIPPHAQEAEKLILGALMSEPTCFEQVDEMLKPQDFYLPQHAKLYEIIQALARHNRPFDAATLVESLSQDQRIESVGGESYLYHCLQSVPSIINIVAYAGIVREKSVLRQLIASCQEIAGFAYHPNDGESWEKILDKAEQRIFSIGDQRMTNDQMPESLVDVLARTTERIDLLHESKGSITGLPTGFNDLDKMTSGLQPGDLVIVAGRPSMGKTVFGVNIAEHAAIKTKKPVVIFSLEMPSEMIVMRMLSSLGRINQQRLRTGQLQEDDWSRLTSAISMLADVPIFIDDQPGLSPHEIKSRLRRIAKQHGEIGLVLVDYLQLMQVPEAKDNRTNEISIISRSLKLIAKELSTPVIALSQLNRGLEQRQDKRPVMSDLRESGAIEQDADLIAFIYRDEVYNEHSPDQGVAEIIIGKQRNGPIGKVRLTFLGEYVRFENHTPVRHDVAQYMED
jgi:replicative DNA helicase